MQVLPLCGTFNVHYDKIIYPMQNTVSLTVKNNECIEHVSLIYNSFKKLLGYPLIASHNNLPHLVEQLFNAPFVLLSHDAKADPLFNYANAKGLELFELNMQELICLPSRLSAEPCNQIEREKLLGQVTTKGFIDNYHGVRISKTGKRFQIHNAIVWNLINSEGFYQGQAACFSEWTFLESSVVQKAKIR